MPVYIVDDEQRRDRSATPMCPSGSGGAGAPAALALLDVNGFLEFKFDLIKAQVSISQL